MLDVTRCGIKIDARSLCQEPRDPGCWFNLCHEHLLAVVRHGIDVGWAEPPVCDPTVPVEQPKLRFHQPIVYYVRFGSRIKIGTTQHLDMRLRNLPYDQLLAVEPGDVSREAARHRQFRDCRIGGQSEWFDMTPDLWAHIRSTRMAHGDLGLVTGRMRLSPEASLH